MSSKKKRVSLYRVCDALTRLIVRVDEGEAVSAKASVLQVELFEYTQLVLDPLDASATYTIVGIGNHESLCFPIDCSVPLISTLSVLPVREKDSVKMEEEQP